MSWYQITGKKLMIVLGISFLWIIAGWILYVFWGSEHGPEGGLDSIADAIAYVFIWKLFIYVPPIFLTVSSTLLWLWQNHRKAIIWLLAAVVIAFVLTKVYDRYIRKMVYTPERVATHTESFEEWEQKRRNDGVSEKWTENDLVCEYIGDLINKTLGEFRSMYDEDEIGTRTSYINAAVEAHYKEIPHVEGWEYIPDIRKIIPARIDGDDKFLLNNSELCGVAEHYQRTLNRNHWYDRYQFEQTVIAEWYSWLPMFVIFYDDGTLDIIIAT